MTSTPVTGTCWERSCTRHDSALEGGGVGKKRPVFRRERESLSIRSTGLANDRTSECFYQQLTLQHKPISLPELSTCTVFFMKDEVRTSHTTGEIKGGMYERAPCHGRNHW